MVSAIIFAIHGVAALVIFFTRRKQAGLGEGFLAVGLFAILFSVGWTILTMFTKLFLAPEGLARWLDRDAVTLSCLTIVETAVYLALKPKKGKKAAESSTSA
jgi:hypothetical protein